MDPERFELSAFSMPLRRAPNCAMGPCFYCNMNFRCLQAYKAHRQFHFEVDLEGFEPSTSSVRLKRAPNCATGPCPSRYQGLIFYLINGGLVKVQNHLLAIIRKNRVESNPKINSISILQAFSASGLYHVL